MKNILTIIQVALSLVLVLSILLQSRGTGMSASFGGGGEFYRSRKGFEKVLLKLTVVVGVLFLVSSIANFLVQ